MVEGVHKITVTIEDLIDNELKLITESFELFKLTLN